MDHPRPEKDDPWEDVTGSDPDFGDPDVDEAAASEDLGEILGLLRRHRDALGPIADAAGPPIPTLPPGYRFEALLHRGGQGVVVKAIQESTDRRVALKIMPADRGHGRQAFVRMEREFEIIRRFQHSNLVRLYDSGQVEGHRYLAMEFIEGRHLDVWLEDEAPPLTERIELLANISRAVHHAHQRGVIHRDLKPSNILIDERGEPHILDFGIAKPTYEQDDLRELTKTGEFAGTLPYASPEQLMGNPDLVDVRTDVHALGLLLHEAVAMRHVWQEHASIADLIRAITERDAPSLRSVAPNADSDLDAIAAQALAKNPEDRYQSAEALEKDLRRWLRRDPVDARSASRWYLLRKILLKNRLVVGTTFIVFLTLVGALLMYMHLGNRERAQRLDLEEAQRLRQEAQDRMERAYRERVQLSDILKLRTLLDRQRTLWPVGPALIPACEQWLAEANDLKDNETLHADALTRLRKRARDYSEEEKRRGHPESYRELREASAMLAGLAQDDPARQQILADLARLEAEIEVRLYYSYDDADDQFFEEQLGSMMGGLVDLDTAIVAVEDRLGRCRAYVEATVVESKEAWDRCLASLAEDPRFAGWLLDPVPGLIPLDKDASGNWTFWHWESGDEPIWEAGLRRFYPGGMGGLVMLLLPPGTFAMGAAPSGGPGRGAGSLENTDAEDKQPVHDVTLAPFFISQYEFTVGQWRRFSERDSHEVFYLPDVDEDVLLRPMDDATWREVVRVLDSLGLELPTEAQWEYACRAGTQSVFPWGDDVPALDGRVNVFDMGSCSDLPAAQQNATKDFDDGYAFLAPVGTYLPNAFGLYDMVGNVSEWCRDSYVSYDVPPDPGDGLRGHPESDPTRVERGGSYILNAWQCTSATRQHGHADVRQPSVGFRAVLNWPTPP
jgi:formylglycine-generating enzyme required for sulfatase activity/predicted Ser/Thr protein kinase